MNNEDLKKALLSEIENCQNNDLLLEALLLLIGPPPSPYDTSNVNEAETGYKKEYISPVPQEHWDLLMKEREEYLKGNVKATSWEDFKKELFEKL